MAPVDYLHPSMAGVGAGGSLLAVPVALDDKQILDLLVASPLYKKLLRIKELVQSGASGKAAGLESSLGGFIDPLDSKWNSDACHEPVPVDQVWYILYSLSSQLTVCVCYLNSVVDVLMAVVLIFKLFIYFKTVVLYHT